MRNYMVINISEIAEVPDSLEGHKAAILKVLDNPGLYKNMRESVFKYYSYEQYTLKYDQCLKNYSLRNNIRIWIRRKINEILVTGFGLYRLTRS
jgi:hypothetical protein